MALSCGVYPQAQGLENQRIFIWAGSWGVGQARRHMGGSGGKAYREVSPERAPSGLLGSAVSFLF